jgi:hypothetical protein
VWPRGPSECDRPRLPSSSARPLVQARASADREAGGLWPIVQNELGLQIDHATTGARWYGNQNRPDSYDTDFDPTNNVQVVRIDQPEARTYSVWVEAGTLTRGPQRFALAATGAPGLQLTPIARY